MPGIVEGKVAIVTGAGRGIGRAIALLMAEEGAAVVVNDVGVALDGSGGDAGPAQEVVNEIKKKGGKAVASTLAIGDPANADKIVASTIETFGRVDILVNNAGILRDKIFHRMSWSDWSDVITVHLHGSFSMARACAEHFRAQNSGSFIHMTSTSGLIGNFGQANYMAAKMGIVGLSRGIALDMQRFNVRSNAIAPFAWGRMIGSIPTETEAEKERVARLQQMTPEKIAPLVVYLGSDKAAGISGQIFSVRNNEIFLFQQTRPLRSIHRADGWTPDKIDAQLKGAFGPSFTPLDRSGEVFSLGSDLMAINYDKMLALKIRDAEQSYTEKDTILYALGVGMGQDPTDRAQLDFVYEKNLKVLPAFACVIGYPGFWVRKLDTGIDWVKIVNGEQGFTLHAPLQGRGTVIGRTQIVDVIDKGAGKGALIYTEREVTDKATGQKLATVTQTTFARADGGFGGPPRPSPPVHKTPERAPDLVCDLATRPEAALVYRLTADLNPLHADLDVAKAAGYPRPIYHGLGTFGVVCHALLKSVAGYDASRMTAMSGRFSAPVFPGETIRTEIWRDGDVVSFRALVPERNIVAMSNGRAEIKA